MDHVQYREQLSALLDGELDDAAREAVTAHMASCEDCRTYFAELTALRDALGDMEEAAVPDGFADGVMARVREEATPRRAPKRRVWRGWAALAACAAVAVLAIHAIPRAGSAGGASVESAPATAAAPPRMMAAAQSEPAEYAAPEAEAPMTDTAAYAGYGAVEGDWQESKMLYMTSGADETPAASDEALNALTEDAPEEPSAAEPDDTLTLTGAGAADWLAEHGEPTEDGRWRVLVEALDALPDTLTLTGIQRPEDGAVFIAPEETEVSP